MYVRFEAVQLRGDEGKFEILVQLVIDIYSRVYASERQKNKNKNKVTLQAYA